MLRVSSSILLGLNDYKKGTVIDYQKVFPLRHYKARGLKSTITPPNHGLGFEKASFRNEINDKLTPKF